MGVISHFKAEYSFLSNFYPSKVEYGGMLFPTIENAYQAAKTLDRDKRKVFLKLSPGEAKCVGQRLIIRDDWEYVKMGIMQDLVWQKFNNPKMRKRLLDTGSAGLIEGNTWGDVFWGAVHYDEHGWVGSNHLGKILMELREKLRNTY